jgi:hypothetical protein
MNNSQLISPIHPVYNIYNLLKSDKFIFIIREELIIIFFLKLHKIILLK